MTDPQKIHACPEKGCAWRGPVDQECPMHVPGDAWERQSHLMPEGYSGRAQTRLRRR